MTSFAAFLYVSQIRVESGRDQRLQIKRQHIDESDAVGSFL